MTNARPDTWMPLYWGDYLRDTGHLGAREHGAYLLLIGHYWVTGRPLPACDTQLARIARLTPREWKSVRTMLAPFFDAGGGVWRHKRIEDEMEASMARLQQKSRAGLASANARAAARRGEAADAVRAAVTGVAANAPSEARTDGNPSSSPPSLPPSPSSSPQESAAVPANLPDFNGANEDEIPAEASVPMAADFWITQEMGDYALRLGWTEHAMLREAEKFRAYWNHGKGAGARRSLRGWFQAWHNWLDIAEKRRA